MMTVKRLVQERNLQQQILLEIQFVLLYQKEQGIKLNGKREMRRKMN